MQSDIDDLKNSISRGKLLSEGGADAAINVEYLKNCVVKILMSQQPSEKQRLVPVIATLLKLSVQEKEAIYHAINASSSTSLLASVDIPVVHDASWNSISDYATQVFGFGTSNHRSSGK